MTTKKITEHEALEQVRVLAEEWQTAGIPCTCGHTLDEHNGLGCYARISYDPLVTCRCTLTDDRHDGLLAAEHLDTILASVDAPAPDEADEPRCRYCGADCSNGRSWDGGDLYACGPCSDARAARNRAAAPAVPAEAGEGDPPEWRAIIDGPKNGEDCPLCATGDDRECLYHRGYSDGVAAVSPVPAEPDSEALDRIARAGAAAVNDGACFDSVDDPEQQWGADAEEREWWRKVALAVLREQGVTK